MPANVTPPSVDNYLQAFRGGVAAGTKFFDDVDGSRYEIWNGAGAVLFNRITSRARGNFENVYFDTARDDSLDQIVEKRYPTVDPRIQLSRGQGTATIARPSVAASDGVLYQGTRIFAAVNGTEPKYYQVASNFTVFADKTEVVVPIEAVKTGTGQALDTTGATQTVLRFEDAVFDATLTPSIIVCADGTQKELDPQFRSRARVERFERRTGYATAIANAMRAAGASEVALFASDFFGDAFDHGLNRIYVADSSFSASADLLLACRLKVFDCVMLGMSPQVLPQQRGDLKLDVVVSLWQPTTATSRDGIEADLRARISNYFTANPYVWNLNALRGAAHVSSEIADISLTASVAEPVIATLFDAPPLTHWFLSDNNVGVSFTSE
jgi:hypothetical protein